MNRRSFLLKTLMGGSGFAIASLADSVAGQIVDGFIQKAVAEEAAKVLDSRIYLNLYIHGGPMRLLFDQWVKTASNESLVFNPYLYNSFTGNTVANGLDYRTFDYNGTLVPHFWNGKVAGGDGSHRDLKAMLNHALVIRGFGTPFDGHDTNDILVHSPVAGLPTLSGMIADQNNKIFSAVGGRYFYSTQSKAATPYGGGYLKDLMSFFNLGKIQQESMNLKETNKAAYERAMSYLKTYARSNRLGAATLQANMSNASILLKKGIDDVDSYWTEAVARYKRAAEATFKLPNVAGVTDLPILRQNFSQELHNYFKVFAEGGPLANDKRRDYIPALDFDFRTAVNSAMLIDSIQEPFALAEYIVVNDLSPAVSIASGSIIRPEMRTDFVSGDGNWNHFNTPGRQLDFVFNDMDSVTGPIGYLLFFHSYYAAIMAGLMEFKAAIETKTRSSTGKNLWQETVVHLTSEFARNGAISGQGSGHGYRQMVSSVFSGAIQQGPYVVGNLARDAGQGTNGTGAPIGNGYQTSEMPGPATMNSTVTSLLRVPHNPYQNTAPSLIEFNESSGLITYPFGKGKIVG